MTGIILGLLATLALTDDVGSWRINEQIDAITDAYLADAVIVGDTGVFRIQCNRGRNRFRAAFASVEPLRSFTRGQHIIYLRIDDDRALEFRWPRSGRQLVPSDREADQLVARLASAERLVIRTFRIDGSLVDANFEVAGANAAINELRSRCQM